MNISIHSLESLVIVNTNISTIDICDSQGWLLVYGILVYLNIFNDFLMHDDCLMTD